MIDAPPDLPHSYWLQIIFIIISILYFHLITPQPVLIPTRPSSSVSTLFSMSIGITLFFRFSC